MLPAQNTEISHLEPSSLTGRAGYTPWHLNINNTPNSYQGAVGKGFRLKQGGFLNADLDYTYSNGNPTSKKRYFQRINTSMRWSNEFSEKLNWNNNLSLNLGYAFDGQRNDPDQTVKAAEMESKKYKHTVFHKRWT